MIDDLPKFTFTEPFCSCFKKALRDAERIRSGEKSTPTARADLITEAQKSYLKSLGYKDSFDLTKAQASAEIGRLKRKSIENSPALK